MGDYKALINIDNALQVLHKDQQVTADEIRDYCREKLAAYKIPKHVEFRDSLPKSMVGKVLRRELVSEQLRKEGQSTN